MLFPILALMVVIADQATKLLITSNLIPGQSIPVGLVAITYVRNSGAAFGVLANQNMLIIFAVLVGVAAIILYYAYPPFQSSWTRVSLGLLLGGAIGNLIDRLRFGFVVDFIDLRVWPVFNVADSAITTGICVLAYYLLFKAPKTTRR
ncbi:MAG: signal peptidase II [Chloroflexi bacterium]|nr:signal peptidase II [Chloroflexota bacterium]